MGSGIKNNNRYSIIGDSNLSKRIGVISSKYDTRLLNKNKISYNPFAEASRVVMRKVVPLLLYFGNTLDQV